MPLNESCLCGQRLDLMAHSLDHQIDVLPIANFLHHRLSGPVRMSRELDPAYRLPTGASAGCHWTSQGRRCDVSRLL